MMDVCRLCLSSEGCLEELFDPYKPDLKEKVLQCTSVEVEHITGLPSCICEVCKSEITIWYKFRKQCIDSDKWLKATYPELFATRRDYGEDFADVTIEYLEVEKGEEYDTNLFFFESEEFETSTKLEKCDVYIKNGRSTCSNKDEDISCENTAEPTNDDCVIDAYKMQGKYETATNGNTDRKKYETLNEDKPVTNEETTMKVKFKKNLLNCNKAAKMVNGNKIKYQKVCPVCGKMQQNLKQHMLIHTGEKPYECCYCPKRFRQQCNLKHHLNTHTGEKPYACQLCDKKFGDPASVKSHMVLHTGERRFRCEICGNAFGYSHTLTLHMRTHTNERRHECELCGKKFISKHALKKHFRTHTGEKPYKCLVCSKSFSTSGNLSMHKRVHTQERPYKCLICNTSFKYNCVLNTHMKKH